MPMSTDPYAGANTFSFGDSPDMADDLLAPGASWHEDGYLWRVAGLPRGSVARPQVGRCDLVLDGSGRRAAIIETVEVTVRRFDEVDEGFAFEEGEGSREELAEWRENHRAYFERNGGFLPDMESLVCERFRLVEILPRPED